MSAQPFAAGDYEGQVVPSRQSAGVLAPIVKQLTMPFSVLDVGCGAGSWLAAFAELGCEVVGIEGGHPDDSDLQVDRDVILDRDLREPIDLGRRFDLVVSVEVAEHIPAEHADTYLDTLARHGDAILFSAAIPGQGGTYHVNEQWPDYWAERFRKRDLFCYDVLRWEIWDDDRIAWWYRQNLLIFCRKDVSTQLRLRDSGYSAGWPRRLIREELWTRTYEDWTRPKSPRELGSAWLQSVKREAGGRLRRS